MIPYGHQWITEEDVEAVVTALQSDWITTGPRVGDFETALCTTLGCNYAVAVNSGTSALDIAVQSLDLPAGSEIITTPFTFVATSNAILYNKAKPVFADIIKETRNIDPEDIRRKITPNTRAIIYVDYAGHPCDIQEIREIADEYNISLIEDACHALGAKYNGRTVGTFADMTIFSFHPVKHITTGEGGAVVTNDSTLHDKLQMLRNHGIDKGAQERFGLDAGWAYDMKYLGRNYRITDFQAEMGITQLKKLEMFIHKRSEIANLYNREFEDMPTVETPITYPNVLHAWHIYTILVEGVSRDRLFKELRKQGIGANVHYIPAYRFSYYQKNAPHDPAAFPNTEEVFSRIITLPLFPKMTEEDAHMVIEKVRAAIDLLQKGD